MPRGHKSISCNYEYMDPAIKKPARSNLGKNFLTNGSKKSINPFPEYIPDPYERAEDLYKAERARSIEKRLGGAYSTMGKSNQSFTSNYDFYSEEGLPIRQKQKSNTLKIRKPWLNTSKSTKSFISPAGIGKYPEHVSDLPNKTHDLQPPATKSWKYSAK